ncbi:hypothetical protein J1614_005053 [Plenodomus biglobosus]|nr:hypothetical protein J1614_005053 [Plenodomus biglobosus]
MYNGTQEPRTLGKHTVLSSFKHDPQDAASDYANTPIVLRCKLGSPGQNGGLVATPRLSSGATSNLNFTPFGPSVA